MTNVRVIQHTSATLFWLEVDSGKGPAGPSTPVLPSCRRVPCAALVEPCCDKGLEARAACHECVRHTRLKVE